MPLLNEMLSSLTIKVGTRSSSLARAQVKEVLEELRLYHPFVHFEPIEVITTGDLDQQTSLKTLDKTDFFTKQIDDLLLQGKCRIAVHSAKDLPDPLPKRVTLACLTKGIDPADVLVLSPGTTLSTLKRGALIATSSYRREQMIKELREDLLFCDIRGTIEQRLMKLKQGEVEGIVMAEAALIRLGLTDLNRIRLPGPTAEGQGQLAIMARQEDKEILELFACMDYRKR